MKTVVLRTTDGRVVCERCLVAETPLARMRGLLGRRGLDSEEGLLLRPAPSVHTFFMRFAIDVVFLARDGEVVKVVPSLRPWRTPHIRARYAYARLVDILGDELEGGPEARLAALDELERQVDAAFRGAATWPLLVEVQRTIRKFDLPSEPFLRLIEANRMDQRISQYESWEDLKHYCAHSADPSGHLVLGVLGRRDDAQAVALSDEVCTGLQLVNFLQDVPRDLARGGVYLPAEDRRRFGV